MGALGGKRAFPPAVGAQGCAAAAADQPRRREVNERPRLACISGTGPSGSRVSRNGLSGPGAWAARLLEEVVRQQRRQQIERVGLRRPRLGVRTTQQAGNGVELPLIPLGRPRVTVADGPGPDRSWVRPNFRPSSVARGPLPSRPLRMLPHMSLDAGAHTDMHACTHTHNHAYMHKSAHTACTHTHTYGTQTHRHTHALARTNADTHTRTHTRTHAHTHTRAHARTHTTRLPTCGRHTHRLAHTHTHTHPHAHRRRQAPAPAPTGGTCSATLSLSSAVAR
jgi:hypothetical protein